MSPKVALNSETGISLVELLVVIILIAVLSSIALLNPGNANEQFKRQNATKLLKVALEEARIDSVKRRADGISAPQAYVQILETSFLLRTDQNLDGLLDSADGPATSLPPNILVAGLGGISVPVVVSFNQRGEPVVAGGLNADFLICNVDCTSPGTDDADHLVVTPSGTVNVLGGASTPIPFNSPGTTNITPTSQISNRLYVP